jgi:membrane-bound ClpP family serine protease
MSDFQKNGASDAQTQTVESKPSNKAGVVGFVCALLGPIIFFVGAVFMFMDIDRSTTKCTIVIGAIVAVVGLILSFVGVFKKPKGFAIAGLIITGIYVLIAIIANESSRGFFLTF